MSDPKPCKLSRISTRPLDKPGPFPLRTEEIVGSYDEAPCPGERFSIVAESLSKEAGFRLVSTSPVVEVEKTSFGFRFKTANSTYELETVLG